MKLRPLLEVSSELRALGYSRTFVRCFAEQLYDHFRCLIEEQGWQDDGQAALEQRFTEAMGSRQELVRAVTECPALDPWPRRYPVLFYLWIPGILTVLLTIGMLHLLFTIRDNIENVPLGIVSLVDQLAFFLPVTIPLIGAITAVRYRVPVFYPLLLALMIAGSTLFIADVEWCGQTANPFFYSLWRFEPLRFALPLLATGLVLLAGRWFARIPGGPRAPQRFAPNSLRLAMCVVAMAVLAFAFHKALDKTAAIYRQHPTDNVIESYASQAWRNYRVVTVMSKSDIRSDLDLSEQQSASIDQTLDDFKKSSQSLVSASSNGMASSTPEYGALMANISARLLCALDDRQKQRLNQLTWQLMRWRVLQLPEVRKELEMSDYQFHMYKIVLLKAIQEESRWNKRWYRADGETRKQVEGEIKAMIRRFDLEYSDVLTDKQIARLKEMKGEPLPPALQSLADR